ncbi:MAG TPA: hypothetical protein VE591_04810 [Candidatus Acidoferrum sp.]|nr:hypothetical protein [Candidatus Acidoferrum sp.]
MTESPQSTYQATLFVRRSNRDAAIEAARALGSRSAVSLWGDDREGNVLQILVTFKASSATEAERLVRRTFSETDAVLAIGDVELRPAFQERRTSYAEPTP